MVRCAADPATGLLSPAFHGSASFDQLFVAGRQLPAPADLRPGARECHLSDVLRKRAVVVERRPAANGCAERWVIDVVLHRLTVDDDRAAVPQGTEMVRSGFDLRHGLSSVKLAL